MGGAILWCGALLCTALLFGGGTRHGFLGDIVTQIAALPLLMCLIFNRRVIVSRWTLAISLLTGIWIAIVAVQLLPVGALFGWRPASHPLLLEFLKNHPYVTVTPTLSMASAVYSIVPASIFFSVALLDAEARFTLIKLIFGLGVASLLIGFAQVIQGPESSLRFFEFTNPTEAVGFFANRNHYAAILCVTLVMATVWFGYSVRSAIEGGAKKSLAPLWVLASFGLMASIVAGLALARSRAGFVLAMIALLGGYAVVAAETFSTRSQTKTARRRIGFAIVGAALFAIQAGLVRILSRFETDPLDDLRIPLARTTIEALPTVMPFGTGLGSFVTVYGVLEKIQDATTVFGNRAHNDYLEFALEAGVLALAMMCLFLMWMLYSCGKIWRSKPSLLTHDVAMTRATTIVIGLILLHSIVDYPLRTGAISALFAFACGIIAFPPQERVFERSKSEGQRRPSSADAPVSPQTRPRREFEAWKSEREWPKEPDA